MTTRATKQNNRRRLPADHDHAACASCARCERTLPRLHYGVTICATCRKRAAGRPVTGPRRPAGWKPAGKAVAS